MDGVGWGGVGWGRLDCMGWIGVDGIRWMIGMDGIGLDWGGLDCGGWMRVGEDRIGFLGYFYKEDTERMGFL